MATIRIDSEMPDISENRSEIPIAPPSINELGSRNPLSPKPAEKILINIKMASFTKFVTLFFKNKPHYKNTKPNE
jgi:hypothetical protein